MNIYILEIAERDSYISNYNYENFKRFHTPTEEIRNTKTAEEYCKKWNEYYSNRLSSGTTIMFPCLKQLEEYIEEYIYKERWNKSIDYKQLQKSLSLYFDMKWKLDLIKDKEKCY